MTRTSATYEHKATGRPHVVLKWSEANGKWDRSGRVTVRGILLPQEWFWANQDVASEFVESELARFDRWAADTYREMSHA